jgi:hypothetical protein
MWPDRPQCPDCTAPVTAAGVTHDATCPLGLGLDAVTDDDRDWFAAHPDAPWRYRPMTIPEAEHLRMHGADAPDPGQLTGWRVRVRPIADGVRARMFIPPRSREAA